MRVSAADFSFRVPFLPSAWAKPEPQVSRGIRNGSAGAKLNAGCHTDPPTRLEANRIPLDTCGYRQAGLREEGDTENPILLEVCPSGEDNSLTGGVLNVRFGWESLLSVRALWRWVRMGGLTTTDKLFRVAIVIKGIDGAAQLIGGILLAVIPSSAVTGLAHAVITRDLLGDPSGTLATHLQRAAENFADGSSKTFAVVYLLAHGLIKLGLVVALARKIMRMYPVAVVVLGAFVIYEVVRAVRTHSIALPFFAALDVIIIVLVVREYLELRRQQQPR